MSLAEFAVLVDAPGKWVLNTRAVLGSRVRYTLATAERLALTRLLNNDIGIALPRAWALAGVALASDMAQWTSGEGPVRINIDITRLRAAVATRRSQLVNIPARLRAGRKPAQASNPLTAARVHGLDIGLLRSNLARKPAQRLRQLDAMAEFRSRVRRKS